jgi:putative oxidoreductase
MNQIRPFAILSARVLIAAIFLINGFGIADPSFAIHEMILRGIPPYVASLFDMAGRAIQIVAGIGLIAGFHQRICAVALIAFLIPATLIAHSFWMAPTHLFQIQLINFFKNLSMIGTLLLIASIDSPATGAAARRSDSAFLLQPECN